MSKKVMGLIGLAFLAVVSVVFVVGMGGVPADLVSEEVKTKIISQIHDFSDEPSTGLEFNSFYYETKYSEVFIDLELTSFTDNDHHRDTGFGYLDLLEEEKTFNNVLASDKKKIRSTFPPWFLDGFKEAKGVIFQVSSGFFKPSGSYYIDYIIFRNGKKVDLRVVIPMMFFDMYIDFDNEKIKYSSKAKRIIQEFDLLVHELAVAFD